MKSLMLIAMVSSVQAFAEAPALGGGPGGLGPFLPMILMFGIIYFLMIRPQQKKAKLQQEFLTQLKRGDMVVTQAGIIGTVRTVSEKLVTLEVDEGVCLKVLKAQILENASRLNDDAKAKALEAKPKTV